MPCSGMKSPAPRAPGASTGWVLTDGPPLVSKSGDSWLRCRLQRSTPIRCVACDNHASMDEIDRQIVALLRQGARRSFQSIGLRVSLSAPAVKRRGGGGGGGGGGRG